MSFSISARAPSARPAARAARRWRALVFLGCPVALALVIGVAIPRGSGLGARARTWERRSPSTASLASGIEAPLRGTKEEASHLRMDGAAALPGAASYVPHEVVVEYRQGASSRARGAALARAAGAVDPRAGLGMQTIHLKSSVSVASAVASLRRSPEVRWAVPNYIAHEASAAP